MVGHKVYGLQGTWLKSEKEKGADCIQKKFVCVYERNWVECISQKKSVECTKESTIC